MPDIPQSITKGDRIGEGGQGYLYAVEGAPGLVYKEYKEDQLADLQPDVLDQLVKEGSTLTLGGRSIKELAVWPLQVVKENGRTTGFIMEHLRPEFFFDGGNLHSKVRSFMYLASPWKPAWGEVELPTTQVRLKLLTEVANALRILHHRKIVIGDISLTNIAWALNGSICLMDCDSFLHGGRSVSRAPINTPDWNDPQSQAGVSNESTDCYKLGLLVYRVLRQETTAVPLPRNEPSQVHLPNEQPSERLLELLNQTGDSSARRPSAQDWWLALSARGQIPITQPDPGKAQDNRSPMPAPKRRWIAVTPPQRRDKA